MSMPVNRLPLLRLPALSGSTTTARGGGGADSSVPLPPPSSMRRSASSSASAEGAPRDDSQSEATAAYPPLFVAAVAAAAAAPPAAGSASVGSRASLLDETINEETDQDVRSELSSEEDGGSFATSTRAEERERIQRELDRAGGVLGRDQLDDLEDERCGGGMGMGIGGGGGGGAPMTSISIDNLVAMKYGLAPLEPLCVSDTERDSGYEAAVVTPSPRGAGSGGGKTFSALDAMSGGGGSPISSPRFHDAPEGVYPEVWTHLGFRRATAREPPDSGSSASERRRGRSATRMMDRARSLPPPEPVRVKPRSKSAVAPPRPGHRHPVHVRAHSQAAPTLHSRRRPKPQSWKEERRLRSPLHHTVEDSLSESDSYDSERSRSSASWGRSVKSSMSCNARSARRRRLSMQQRSSHQASSSGGGAAGGGGGERARRSRTLDPPMDRRGWDPDELLM